MSLKRGDVIWGQYQIDELIGGGGMALVYRVRDLETDKIYAAKVLREEQIQRNDYVLEQFEHEAEIHPQLRHDHIVRCYHAYTNSNPRGLLLQYIRGHNIRDLLRAEKNLDARLLPIINQMTDALAYLHGQGLCHCDLKPHNILYDEQTQRYYLTDFGIAQAINTPLETRRGTPRYMAPEQHLAQPVDARTDVYSFALTVYEILTGGHLPFKNNEGGEGTMGSVSQWGEQHIYHAPPHPSYFRPQIREAVDEVVLKALSEYPEDRYASVRAFYQAMMEATETVGSRAIPTQTGTTRTSQTYTARLICTTGQIRDPITVKQEMLIGRSKECRMRLSDDNRISRRHALVKWSEKDQAFVVWDQDSKLGTRVNGRRIINRERPLRVGDLITIGGYNFRYEGRQ